MDEILLHGPIGHIERVSANKQENQHGSQVELAITGIPHGKQLPSGICFWATGRQAVARHNRGSAKIGLRGYRRKRNR